MSEKITFDSHYKGMPINTSKARELGAFTVILEAIYDQLQSLLSRHSRVTVLAFDLHLPYGNFSTAIPSNQLVTAFIKKIKEDLSSTKWKRHNEVIHCWAREVGRGRNAHYHCYIGFKQVYRRIGEISEQGCTGLWGLLQDRWKSISGGFARPSNAHTVNRDNHIEFGDAFYHLSYMAKVRDKDFGTGQNHKRYSRSRIPHIVA